MLTNISRKDSSGGDQSLNTISSSLKRRSFLKYCAAGGVGMLSASYHWPASLLAQMGSPAMTKKFHPEKTLCACFNLPSLEMAKSIGAQGTRLIFHNLEQGLSAAQSGKLPHQFQLIKDLSEAGIPVIATPVWIAKQTRKLPEPDSAEWKKWLETTRSFIQLMGPYLVGITLDNEPITAYHPSEFLPNKSGIVPAITWFQALAATIRKSAPHLLISTPGLNTLEHLEAHPHSPMKDAVDQFFQWARNDTNIDVVDVHAHFNRPETIDSVLSYTATQFPRGIIITEWSEAGRFKAWDEAKLDAAFASKWKRDGSLSNREYILQCEKNPVSGPGDSRVSLEEWNNFVATAPIDPNFMENAFQVMKKHQVLFAAYGAAVQYGNPLFDIKQLYANLSVVPGPDGKPQPNYKFPEWFKAMVATA